MNRIHIKITSILICLLFLFGVVMPPEASAIWDDILAWQGSGEAYKDDPEGKNRAKEEEAAQKKNAKVSQYLEEARKLRFEKNFRGARAKADRALRIDPDSKLAEAFLKQLEIEEKRYSDYQERLKREKEEKKRAEKEAREKARQEARAEKTRQREAPEKETAPRETEAEKEGAPGGDMTEEPGPVKKPEDVAEVSGEPVRPEERQIPEADLEKLAKDQKIERPDFLPEDIDIKAGQSIIVDGDKVEYFEEQGKIVATGNVSINYGDTRLTCDRIEVNAKQRIALCEGNVIIQQEDGVLTGERIRYDFNSRQGEIIGGEVDAFPWFAKAEETARVSENEYILKKGFLTTCDLDKPHYRIEAGQIQIFPDDKVIARDVVFRIGEVPVLWLPYYYHPIIQSRAKVQLIPGWESDWGFFLLSAWRFYLRGESKVDVLVDYRTQKGFAGGADFYYNMPDFGLKGLGSGLFRIYSVFQNGWGTYKPTEYRDEGTDYDLRYRYQWKHRIDFEPGTVAMLEMNKLSDKNFLKDYYYNEYEENNENLPNYLSVISAKSNFILNLTANARLNDFYTVTQRLPEVSIDIPDQRLWGMPLYYGAEWSGAYFDKRYASDSINPEEKVGRLDTRHRLSYVANLKYFNLKPYGEIRETLYSRTMRENRGVARTIFGGGVSAFTRIHRIYNADSDFLNMDINGIRHIVAPSVDYYYRHKPDIADGEVYPMDDIDTLGKENGIRFSLENKLQTKRHDREGSLRTVDLVRFIAGVDFSFYQTYDPDGNTESRFSDLNFDLELRPWDWMFLQSEVEVDTTRQALRSASVETVIDPVDHFQMALGYRYEKTTPDLRNQVTFDMEYRLNPKWKVGWYERFDLHKMDIEEQQFRVVRDLHCWELETVLDVDGWNPATNDFSFWFAFKLKAFPDLPIGLSRSYEKRPPGALSR